MSDFSRLENATNRILKWLNARSHRVLIGLAGVPGAGKSTFVEPLSERVNALAGPQTMVVLGMDGFHLSKATLAQFPDPAAAFARRGAPWTFDAPALQVRLQQLRLSYRRQSVLWPDFRHDVGDPIEGAHEIASSVRLVLVEGLYLLCEDGPWRAVSAQFDERWFLDTPLEIALERLTQRHQQVWGRTRAAAQERIQQNDALNAEIVLASRERADWWV
jgi:pantothenate kinase